MPEQVAPTTAPAAPAAPVAPAAPAAATAEGGKDPAQNTADQATAPQPGSEQKPDTDGDDPEKKRQSRRFERRLDKAYRREAEARARADLLEKQLTEARRAASSPADPNEPKLEQFKDIEEYAAAKAKYHSDKALRDHTEKQRQESQQKEIAALTESWTEKAEVGAEKYEDWEEVVGDVKLNSPWTVAAAEADNAADIMYWLGKNIKEAQRIAGLSPRAQIREIGKLEEKLIANPPTKPKAPSKAPAPITPVSGAAPVISDVPSEEDDMKTWIAKRNKQVYGKRG